ncbi:MAG: sulfatase [Acidobacteriota bacterium]
MMRKLLLFCLLVFGCWLPISGGRQGVGSSGKNVLLFTVDSCRPDRFSLYGNPRKTTPNIDAWARTAVVYENAFAVSAWTAPGLVSILTGLYPWEHGVDSRDRIAPQSVPTLSKIFKSAGYLAPNLNFFTFAPYFQNLGLGEIEREYFTQTEGEELLNWLDKNVPIDPATGSGQKFFAWYHTTTVHQPYRREKTGDQTRAGGPQTESEGLAAVQNGAIVPAGSVKFTAQDRPALLDLYDSEVEHMDRFFGKVLAKLKEKKVLEETVIVLTADHGEELLDHGFVGHASTSLEAKLYDEVIRIPLIVSAPGHLKSGRRSELIQQVDLFPMILSLAGLKKEPVRPPRKKVFLESVIAGNQTTREREGIWLRAVRTRDKKYIERWENGAAVSREFYDLRRDPAEKHSTPGSLEFPTPSPGSKVTAKKAPSQQPGQMGPCPLLHMPRAAETLRYVDHTGAILFQWEGDREQDYIVEYDIGTGDHHVAGTYPAKGNYQVLGPFPKELWQSLKAWNPFRIRVSPAGGGCWSEWREFYF